MVEGEKKLSKNALKKIEKEKAKLEKAEKLRKEQEEKLANDPSREFFGDYPMIQSQEQTQRKWTKIGDLTEAIIG